jgi:uncharacterized membrane protein YedE/YeeE
MTQTGGLDILLAWTLFAAILGMLAYFLLRHRKDPLQEIATPTADDPEGGDGTACEPATGPAPQNLQDLRSHP